MKIPVHIATKLLQLLNGSVFTASQLKHNVIEELVSEGIIERSGRVQKKLLLLNKHSLQNYLLNKFGINDLEKYIETNIKEDTTRGELIEVASDSKLKQVRTFKGFLLNSYIPISATLNGQTLMLNFTDGIFKFIYDFENFTLDENITIVGIENPECFRNIDKLQYLFKDLHPLFVCRYPQNQSKDLIKWLQSITNNYLHFGDFDFAGIKIYLSEYKKHLGGKASMFVPINIEETIIKYGNKKLYDIQSSNFSEKGIEEREVLNLITLFYKYRKVVEQEIYINLETEIAN